MRKSIMPFEKWFDRRGRHIVGLKEDHAAYVWKAAERSMKRAIENSMKVNEPRYNPETTHRYGCRCETCQDIADGSNVC